MDLCAGGDWSGKTRDDVFVFALAALPDAEVWYQQALKTRQQLGIARHMELHAHSLTEYQRLRFLQAANGNGMIVGAIVLQKSVKAKESSAALFDYASSARQLFGFFAQRYCLKRLWYDEEIKGKATQQKFETELHRLQRINHTESMKAKCRPSHTSDMVQLADIVAYVLRRHITGAIKNPLLCQEVQQIVTDPRNLIMRR